MNKQLIGMLALVLFAGCALPNDRPNFNALSDEELALYNAAVPFREQVICRRDPQTGSHLRRKTCMTREENDRAMRNDVEILHTVNSGPAGVELR